MVCLWGGGVRGRRCGEVHLLWPLKLRGIALAMAVVWQGFRGVPTLRG